MGLLAASPLLLAFLWRLLRLDVGADLNRAHQTIPQRRRLWHARDDFGLHEIADLLRHAALKATLRTTLQIDEYSPNLIVVLTVFDML